MSIVRYRKLPVEVDTIQWTGDNEAEVQDFTGGASHFYALDAEDREGSDDPEATATVFDRLHSTWVLVYTGQHIVRGVKGEFYPIAEDVLAETYERVEEEAAPDGTTATPTDTNRRARLLHEMADGTRWKSGDVVRWYETQGLPGFGIRAARHDLAILRDSGAITQHDEKGVRFYTRNARKDSE